jgi:hypothetical protein
MEKSIWEKSVYNNNFAHKKSIIFIHNLYNIILFEFIFYYVMPKNKPKQMFHLFFFHSTIFYILEIEKDAHRKREENFNMINLKNCFGRKIVTFFHILFSHGIIIMENSSKEKLCSVFIHFADEKVYLICTLKNKKE